MQYSKMVPGTFLRRPNRFIAHIAIDGKEEQLIKNCEVRRVLLVMEAAFKSAENLEALKVNI